MKNGFRSPAVPALTRAETSPSTHGQSAPRIGSFGCRLPPGEGEDQLRLPVSRVAMADFADQSVNLFRDRRLENCLSELP